MADELGTGSLSKHIPKDYPTSPDIEDRRNEHPSETPIPFLENKVPEIVIRSKPAYPEVRKARKQQ